VTKRQTRPRNDAQFNSTTMGGDDLGSDDEYFLAATSSKTTNVVVGQQYGDDDDSINSSGSVGADADDEHHYASDYESSPGDDGGTRKQDLSASLKKKRRKNREDDEGADIGSSSRNKKKKKKEKKDPSAVLLEAARQLETQSSKQQAAFLDAALRHHKLLSLSRTTSSSDDEKMQLPKDPIVQPQHIFRPSNSADGFAVKLKEAVSLKKLKKWKHLHSPCVVCSRGRHASEPPSSPFLVLLFQFPFFIWQIIVCISARRAVATLKELSSLKMRTAKLFPKNGSVEEQRQLLASNSYGIAVGTPHRLNALLSDSSTSDHHRSGPSSSSSLSLDRTLLVVLDCHVSHKQYTVSTIPDTAQHCMELLDDHVLPQLQGRKDIRVAFF